MTEITRPDATVGVDWHMRVSVAALKLAESRMPGVPLGSPVRRQMEASGLSAARAALQAIHDESPPAWRRLSRKARSNVAVRTALCAMNAHLRMEGF